MSLAAPTTPSCVRSSNHPACEHRARLWPGFFYWAVLTTVSFRRIESDMDEVVKYDGCFVCGDRNRIGLRAKFMSDGQQVFTEIVARDEFEGYPGIYHGGVMSALLDEVMIKAILARAIVAVTAEMTVRFVRPVRTGETIRFTARVVANKGRAYFTEGEATGRDGQRYATAAGKYLEARSDLRARLMGALDPI